MKKRRFRLARSLAVYIVIIIIAFFIAEVAFFYSSFERSNRLRLNQLIRESAITDVSEVEQQAAEGLFFIAGSKDPVTITTFASDTFNTAEMMAVVTGDYADGDLIHFELDERQYLGKIYFVGNDYYFLFISASSFNPFFLPDVYLFTFMFLVIIGGLGSFLYFRLRQVGYDINLLEKNIELLNNSNFETPFRMPKRKELTYLAQALERIREEIATERQTRTEILQTISHDLKTPIAVIKSYLEAVKDGVVDFQQGQEVIGAQASRLEQEVRALVEYSALANFSYQDLTSFPIAPLIAEVVSNNQYRSNDIVIKIINNSDLVVSGIVSSWRRVVENLLDNALRYASHQIIIKIDEEISFYNDGPALEEAVAFSLFEPLVKGSKGNFGLGLTIVKRTLELFAYQIAVTSNDAGVTFTIKRLPKSEQ